MKKKKGAGDNYNVSAKLLRPNLELEFILDDFVLPPKSIMIGKCSKKNTIAGYSDRYLMLGHS